MLVFVTVLVFVSVREAAAASDGKGTIGKLTTPRALTPDSEVGSRSARSLSPSSSSRDSRRVFSYRRPLPPVPLLLRVPFLLVALPATHPSVPSAARFNVPVTPRSSLCRVPLGVLRLLPPPPLSSCSLSLSISISLSLSLSIHLRICLARCRSFPLTIANGSTPRATNRRLAERPVDYL